MGRRGLPFQKALIGLIAASLVAAGCNGGGDDSDPPTAPAGEVSPSVPVSTTAASVPSPSPSPTPELLGPRPKTSEEAVASLQRYLERGGGLCTSEFKRLWGVATCLTGDFDGDAKPDTVVLVPLEGGAGRSPNAGVVLLRRGTTFVPVAFPVVGDGDADASPAGLDLFSGADRNGDGRADITYLATGCGASNCASEVQVQAWDGTAWRDIGPGERFDNPTSIRFQENTLTVKAGTLQTVGAGPTRPSISTYGLKQGRFALTSKTPEQPVYLYHAILDADAKFDAGDFKGAVSAYEAAMANTELKDWQKEVGTGDGRVRLKGYALFRVAVATAAQGGDARAAFDRAILEGKEPVFTNTLEAFRRGLQEQGGVHNGCIEATKYLSLPGVPAALKTIFEYGYANPRKEPQDICPL